MGDTLRALSQLEYPSENVEIIIVDNNSTDNTLNVSKSVIDSLNFPFTVSTISERRQGLNYARDAGLNAARYENAVFCDDDNWLDARYLTVADQLLRKHTDAGIFGGYGIAVTEVTPPQWFDEVSSGYAVGKKAQGEGYLEDRGSFVAGAGMIIRLSVWHKLKSVSFGNFLSDRKGSQMSSAGDLELCLAARLAGFRIYYSEALCFHHFIPAERLTWEYVQRGCIGYAKTVNVIESYLYIMRGDIDTKSRIKTHFNLGVVRNVLLSYLKASWSLMTGPSPTKKIRYYIASGQLRSALTWWIKGYSILVPLFDLKQRLKVRT
jgi:glycosyltransferase involved in cell wall biosynthesis